VDLIVGLGNPGIKYRNTRHNIGFRVINSFSRELGIRLTGRRFDSRNARTNLNGKKIILLRPITFMNLSGKSVKACADYHGISNDSILIIHDDLDLPLGKIKAVNKGGAGGHRGVQSIIDHLGDTKFPRIKIGIGRPQYGEGIEDFVLSPFYKIEKKITEKVISISVQACRLFISEGIETAMNRINSKKLKFKEETI